MLLKSNKYILRTQHNVQLLILFQVKSLMHHIDISQNHLPDKLYSSEQCTYLANLQILLPELLVQTIFLVSIHPALFEY